MKIYLQELQQKGKLTFESLSLDMPVEMWQEMDRRILFVNDVNVDGTITYHGNYITIDLSVEADIQLESSVSLKPVQRQLEIQELFEVSITKEYETEDGLFEFSNEIDLTPYVSQLVVAELPIRILGEDEDAYFEETYIAPEKEGPLSKLKDLF